MQTVNPMAKWVLGALLALFVLSIVSIQLQPKDSKDFKDSKTTQGSSLVGPQRALNASQVAFAPTKVLTTDFNGNVSGIDFSRAFIQPGTIVMWYDSVIPEGWAECDGINGPDLRGRFPLAYDNTRSQADAKTLGNTGGMERVALSTAEMPSHTHTGTTDGAGYAKNTAKSDDWGATNMKSANSDSSGHTHDLTTEFTGGTNTTCSTDADCIRINSEYRCGDTKTCIRSHNNMPPYCIVKFIIKL